MGTDKVLVLGATGTVGRRVAAAFTALREAGDTAATDTARRVTGRDVRPFTAFAAAARPG